MNKTSVRYVFDKDVSHVNIWDAPKNGNKTRIDMPNKIGFNYVLNIIEPSNIDEGRFYPKIKLYMSGEVWEGYTTASINLHVEEDAFDGRFNQ